MKDIFLSDAHIKGTSSQQRVVCDFLDSIRDGTSRLFILGDFFDFWFGFKGVVPYGYIPVLSRLMDLREKGVELIYLEGNHDFFMGPFFSKVLSARVYANEASLEVGGRKALIAHGDMVDTGDYGYRLLRRFLRSKPVFTLAHTLPPFLILGLAERFSGMSRRYRPRQRGLRETLRRFAREKWKEGYEVVILGHSHTPDRVEEDGRLYINTGEWIKAFTYLEVTGSSFDLKEYNPSSHHALLQHMGL